MILVRTSWVLGVLWTYLLLGPLATLGPAQTALQRLESQLRKQLGGSSGEKSAPVTTPPAPGIRPAAPGVTASADPQSTQRPRPYLVIVVDDQNDRGRGVRVLDVLSEGPGAKAGLQTQDLITAISGMRVRQLSEMADILELYGPGDKIAFEILRNNKAQKLDLVLGQRQTDPVAAQPAARSDAPAGQQSSPVGTPPRVLQDLPLLPPPPEPKPTVTAKPAADESSRVKQLEQRIEQLEKRIAELERVLAEKGKPGSK